MSKETESSFIEFEPEEGVPLGHDSDSCFSSHLEISFDNMIDTIRDVSDDVVTLSIHDTCCAAKTSPLRVIVNSHLPTARGPQEAIVESSSVSTPQSSSDSNTTLIHDSPENHATLIRDIENASQSIPPSHAPNRRLDFTDESDVLQTKRVNIQDSRNTVRYFSRSKEEKAFFKRNKQLKKKKTGGRVAYAPPLPDTPVTERAAGANVVASVRDTMVEAGSLIRDEVMAKMGQLRNWTGHNTLNMNFGGASEVLEKGFSGSTEKVKQSMLALSEIGTTANGDRRPLPRSISLTESWEENSKRLKAASFTFSEAMRSMSFDIIRVDRSGDSTNDETFEAIELPLDEHQDFIEQCLEKESSESDSAICKSSSSTFERNISIATTISASTTDSSESDQAPKQQISDDSQAASTGHLAQAPQEIDVGQEGSYQALQKKQPDTVDNPTKLDVVHATCRWNAAQESYNNMPTTSASFLEMEPCPTLQQPIILDDECCGDEPSTPPKSNRTSALMPTGPFHTLKRSPSARMRKHLSSTKLKRSPISALDI